MSSLNDRHLQDRERELREGPAPGFLSDIRDFLWTSGKWWLLPFLVVFFLFAVILMLANSAVAPFIYTLF